MPSAAASTSALVTLPPGPEPCTPPSSTPFLPAARRATGVARAAPLPSGCGVSTCVGASLASVPAVAPSPLGAPPALISASPWPTLTTSSGSTRSFVIVPLAGAGTSASTLSVETSITVCPSSTESPSLTCHSSTVPSVTDSPISGISI